MAQKLARHSDVNLTMQTYTHLEVDDLASAVESLPSLRSKQRDQFEADSEDALPPDQTLARLVRSWATLSRQTRAAIAEVLDRAMAAERRKSPE